MGGAGVGRLHGLEGTDRGEEGLVSFELCEPPPEAARPKTRRGRAGGLTRQEELLEDPPDVVTDYEVERLLASRGDEHVEVSNDAIRAEVEAHVCGFFDGLFQEALERAAQKVTLAVREKREREKIEPLVDAMLEEVWGDVLTGIREGRVRVVQVEDEDEDVVDSDVEDIDLDLFMYVDEFVNGVLDDAIDAYKEEMHQQKK